jgi:hypothetical protein
MMVVTGHEALGLRQYLASSVKVLFLSLSW